MDRAMSKVTIEDISRRTGLSRGTVSRALNDRPDISHQTKQRVLEACSELNYVPSLAARSLATGRCYAVAVVVDDLRSAFAGSYVRGVLARAARDNYAVHVSELGADAKTAVDRLCRVASERVDSVILATPLSTELTRQLAESLETRPIVGAVGAESPTFDTYTPDFVEAGRLAGRHILREGATDVLYLHEGAGERDSECVAGFQEVCRQMHIAPEAVTMKVSAEDPNRLAAARERLREVRAVGTTNDFLALEVMLAARELGRVVAVIGLGNEPFGVRISRGLTTIDLCGEEIGRRAMETSIQRITKTRQDTAQHTRVPPVLIVRGSTDEM